MQKRLYRIPKVEKPENARCSEQKFNIAEAALERLLKQFFPALTAFPELLLERLLKQEKTAQTARKMLTDFQSEINKVP